MASIGLVAGAVQITPAGEPIVMLANHPTTGGYPVIGVVDPDDLVDVVQARPGTPVEFRRA
jgi:allophanate hydrolase subunit 2